MTPTVETRHRLASFQTEDYFLQTMGTPALAAHGGNRKRWRVALFGAVAGCALLSAGMQKAHADCETIGSVATCTGDISGGVSTFPVVPPTIQLGPDVRELIIRDLTADINAPLSAAMGMFIATGGDISLDANLGEFTATSSTSTTVFLSTTLGSVTANIVGDLFAPNGNSIFATATGAAGETTAVDITHVGDFTGGAIFGSIAGQGVNSVIINSTGDSEGSQGIFASANSTETANVFVQKRGNTNVIGNLSGIFASAASLSSTTIDVLNIGDITSEGDGIVASAAGNTNTSTSVTLVGDINARMRGIFAGATAGPDLPPEVSVETTGNITTQEESAITAFVNQGAATVTINGGLISGGAVPAGPNLGNGSAVFFFGIGPEDFLVKTNTLNLNGDVTLSSLDGTAVRSDRGDTTINNEGVLNTVNMGAINLGTGSNAFNNFEGATFNSGAVINLGSGIGNLFSNSGTWSPGGSFSIDTSTLTGDFEQTTSGRLLTDINLGTGDADLFTIIGAADLAGLVQPQITDLTNTPQTVTILTATEGVTNSGLSVSTAVLDAQLLYPDVNTVNLQINGIDFTPDAAALNPNQTRLAQNLDQATATGGGGLTPLLLALANGPATLDEYVAALDQLLPEIYLNTETAALFSAEQFISDLFSCPTADGSTAFINENQCVWVRPKGRVLDFDGTNNNIAFEDRTAGISAGVQFELAPGLHANFGAGYENSKVETDVDAESDGTRYHFGAALKYQRESLLLAGAVSAGVAEFETQRKISFPGFDAVAQSDHDVTYFAGQLRAAYLLEHQGANSDWYFKPMVDLNVTHLDRDAINETGAGAANQTIAGGSATYASLSPAIEVGAKIQSDPSTVIRPFVRAGMTYHIENEQDLTAGFAQAPIGLGGFKITTEFDEIFADIHAGLSILKANGSSFSFGYNGLISEHYAQHGIYAKATISF